RFKDIRQVVFDKTGTLTTGELKIQHWEARKISPELFQSVVLGLEHFSTHPISKSILKQWSGIAALELNSVVETKGLGLKGIDKEGREWQLGSGKITQGNETPLTDFDLHLLLNGEWVGGIRLEDEVRSDAEAAVNLLHQQGYKTVLLSGDRSQKVTDLGKSLGIQEIYAEQSPKEKMNHLEQLVQQSPTVMVGDGINDAPALAKADIGVSLSDASQIALQSSNVVLNGTKLMHLPMAIKLGKFTYQTIKQNLFWAFFYNVLAIPLAAMGYLSPIWAAIIMAFSDVILIFNSLRLNYRKINR